MTGAPGTPQTVDDGAYEHVRGMTVPEVMLPSTVGDHLDVCDHTKTFTVLFLYPMTGTPGRPLPQGWMEIPGAFGCTAQSCAYRDAVPQFVELDASVRGVSTQMLQEQASFAAREHISFPLLSDAELVLTRALELPTFIAGGRPRIKRASLVVDRARRVRRVLYPVPDPGANAAETLAVLSREPP